MNRRRSWPGTLLAALALLAAAACGGGSSGPPPETPAPAATATASASAAPSAATATPDSPTPAPMPPPDPSSTPTASPPPTPMPRPTACAETAGQFSSVEVPSTVLGYDIDTRIYLPPCYASSGKSYPVLYLIHGLNFDEGQWEQLGIGGAADRLAAAGEIAPLIIVLPHERGEPGFDPAFVTELVPYVDGHYRTLASAGYRAIGGMSRGGGWSIHLGLRYPTVFGRVGGHSPAIFYGDESNVLRYIRALAANGSAPALYLDAGADDEDPTSAVWLDQMLTAYRIAHVYVRPPGDHSDRYWAAHLDDYLRFYAAVWRPATPTPIPSATQRF